MRERLIETVVWPSDDMNTTGKQDWLEHHVGVQ
jgi:hypothetical protein